MHDIQRAMVLLGVRGSALVLRKGTPGWFCCIVDSVISQVCLRGENLRNAVDVEISYRKDDIAPAGMPVARGKHI
jgi:hypothetical protein